MTAASEENFRQAIEHYTGEHVRAIATAEEGVENGFPPSLTRGRQLEDRTATQISTVFAVIATEVRCAVKIARLRVSKGEPPSLPLVKLKRMLSVQGAVTETGATGEGVSLKTVPH